MITIKGEKIPWYSGITISELLSQVEFGYQYAVIRLNGKLISKPNFESIEIDDNSVIVPLPIIAGG